MRVRAYSSLPKTRLVGLLQDLDVIGARRSFAMDSRRSSFHCRCGLAIRRSPLLWLKLHSCAIHEVTVLVEGDAVETRVGTSTHEVASHSATSV